MATVNVSYSSKTDMTITLASLASDTTQLVGREASQKDNTSDLYDDFLISGFITVGTTPTINKLILVYAVGSPVSMATTNVDVFDGTDSAETVTSAGVGYGILKPVAQLVVDATTSDRKYPFGPVSLASLFGNVVPPFWTIFVTHNTGVNLNSTAGNHAISWVGVKYTIA